jgi:hypothetical protein
VPATFTINLSGKQFGRWTVLRYAGDGRWLCRCECGKEKSVPGFYLRRGDSTSCGCFATELLVKRSKTHGKRHTPEWDCWSAMRQRCFNPKAKAYPDYGARGITVCDRWKDSFENFLADMGPRPGEGYSIERKDNDGNYEPGNCRWAKDIEQEHNKRSNHIISFKGETLPVAVMARKYGLLPGTLGDRLSYGWSIERALTTPTRKRRASNANA